MINGIEGIRVSGRESSIEFYCGENIGYVVRFYSTVGGMAEFRTPSLITLIEIFQLAGRISKTLWPDE